jgi:hypothetical protein
MAFKGPPPSRHPPAQRSPRRLGRDHRAPLASHPCSAISARIDSPAPRSSALRTVLGSGQRQDHHPRVQGPPWTRLSRSSRPNSQCPRAGRLESLAPDSPLRAGVYPLLYSTFPLATRPSASPPHARPPPPRSARAPNLGDVAASKRCRRCGHPQKRSTRRSTGSATGGSVLRASGATSGGGICGGGGARRLVWPSCLGSCRLKSSCGNMNATSAPPASREAQGPVGVSSARAGRRAAVASAEVRCDFPGPHAAALRAGIVVTALHATSAPSESRRLAPQAEEHAV